MTATTTTTWEAVIGLEVHVEMATATKLFCSCKNEFGAEPNTNICPVCLGLPGSLPVLGERAVEFALRVGDALQCTVPDRSLFHRKNYFYPDMPKDYQISQYDEPICVDGSLEVDGFRVGIERAHMEEDTGKSLHVGGATGRIHGADHSLVDYNRAGIPLIEIVTKPVRGTREQAPQVAQRGDVRAGDDRRLRPGAGDRLGDDLDQRDAGAVVVDQRILRTVDPSGRAADMQRLAGVLLEVNPLDADPERLRPSRSVQLHVQPTIGAERLVVLGDLVVLRHVRIEVVLAGEPAPLGDLTVERQADPDRRLDRGSVGHRK